ncbi:hypothetical protein BDN70DRAFT_994821 [Pholiota conissans]|uniref:Heterokaryon incompatibility domain-containing protein n=1 Tax=Pholiota conissans TaxID=109636 RepID=A0A9P5YZP2_9AGAR|nr:hypothetical protein BDN70DRAFT_994821 [Pholiota conissans]
MIHPISSSFQNRKARGTDKTHKLGGYARSEDIGKKDTDAQILLTALRNLIVPLVQSVVPNASAEFDGRPEEENLLIALQKYVASIVGGQVQAENQDEKKITRVINLKALNITKVPEKTKDDVSRNVHRDRERFKVLINKVIQIIQLDIPVDSQAGRSYVLGKLLEALREQVFNSLPVRLLYFERLDDSDMFQISLLDQANIYSRLAEKFTYTYKSTQMDYSTALNQLTELMRYAILSHTWLRSSPGELSYDAWNKGTFHLTHPGYEKLAQFGRASLMNHGISLGWMDTICIDKSSSSELDESIRSMYKWYQDSSVCITYLSETDNISQLAEDPWFTRGWTLQELIAPEIIKFYNCTWSQLTVVQNDRYDRSTQEQITMATTIMTKELLADHIDQVSISRKMQWAARSMSIAYGEGADLAFSRLIKEILSTCKYNVLDVFNWGGKYMTNMSSLLPSSPQAFLKRNEQLKIPPILMEPLALTHVGLRIPALIVPIKVYWSSFTWKYTRKGDYYSSNFPTHPEGIILPFMPYGEELNFSCNVLDVEAFRFRTDMTRDRYAFVVLNCTGDEHNINIPLMCFAILICYHTDDVILKTITRTERVPSVYPVVFPLRKKSTQLYAATNKHSMKRSDLGRHGMQYLSMYI